MGLFPLWAVRVAAAPVSPPRDRQPKTFLEALRQETQKQEAARSMEGVKQEANTPSVASAGTDTE